MKRRSGARDPGARWRVTCTLCAAIVTSAAPVLAQPKPVTTTPASASAAVVEVRGTVLGIDKDDLVLDLGAGTGITENQLIEIWRPLSLKHPVTGKVITDRFKIGQIQVGQVRQAMSLAKPSGTLARDAAPGDVVIFTRAATSQTATTASAASQVAVTPRPSPVERGKLHPATEPSDAAPTEPTPYDEPSSTPAGAEAREVTQMFESLRGQSVATRIMRYEQFLRAHPETRFSQVLYEEAAALRQLMSRVSQPAASASRVPAIASAPMALRAREGQPLRVAVEISGDVRGAVLQLRKKGQQLYTALAMKSLGSGYYAVEIPASRVENRDLEYFIEATGERATTSVIGSSGSPERIRVELKPGSRLPPQGKTQVSVLTDFADYNRLRGNDYAWQTEGTFGIRFKDLGIRAVRMGFGVYRGVSGTVVELDEAGKDGRPVGLTYGYLEGEFGLHRYFSLIARAAVGLLDDGVGGGAQLLGRIGNDRGTNLLLGGEFLYGVGLRSIIELQLNTFERFPIVLRTEVTNQPAGAAPTESQIGPSIAEGQSDVAGRGIVQLGFRPVPELTLAVRGSFQGRNINHAGPGVGGFVGYTW